MVDHRAVRAAGPAAAGPAGFPPLEGRTHTNTNTHTHSAGLRLTVIFVKLPSQKGHNLLHGEQRTVIADIF